MAQCTVRRMAFFGVVVLVSFAGCQARDAVVAKDERVPPSARNEALRLLRDFVATGQAADRANDPKLDDRMDKIAWRMALSGGYDFRGDFELWECWRMWLEERDFSVIRTCLDSDNNIAIAFGIDAAMEGRRAEDLQDVLRRYEGAARGEDELVRCVYRRTIAEWITEHRPAEPGGFVRVVRVTPEFCRRVLEMMKPCEEEMRQIRQRAEACQTRQIPFQTPEGNPSPPPHASAPRRNQISYQVREGSALEVAGSARRCPESGCGLRADRRALRREGIAGRSDSSNFRGYGYRGAG